jgi:hypothetical protein
MYESQIAEFSDKKYYPITATLGYCSKHVGSREDYKNEYGIVIEDGQHRRGVLNLIRKFHVDTLTKECTMVKIHTVEQESSLREHFEVINRNYVPVPMYHIDRTIRGVVDGILDWFKHTFDESFFRSPKGEALRPFLKLDSVKDQLSNNQRILDLESVQKFFHEK